MIPIDDDIVEFRMLRTYVRGSMKDAELLRMIIDTVIAQKKKDILMGKTVIRRLK